MAAKKMKCYAVEPVMVNGARFEPGDEFECSKERAEQLIAAGAANSPAVQKAAEKAAKEQEIEQAKAEVKAAQARLDALTGKGKG